ncbi:MAG: Eco57I restriction-modification methylase domain-containing protein [Candidatus Pacebacteria bacterium]|nr:Eco57I restriction-modification methylase domain-containing protein [Candidatus Paceibacterota bacterium]MBP9840276.1 Eco57I restriction-modification methylase domain-containing protein [Candidatus Paceibacterota bacterium]
MKVPTSYNPDVLTCLANLSNDEVFTPPALVNQILDTLPSEIWRDKTATFLDPVSKTGVFLREIVRRLNDGLVKEIPDAQARLDHIYTKQVFGIAITELTALLSRRSLYCSKDASGKYSVSEAFKSADGNVRFERTEHSWKDGKCAFCGAGQAEYDRAEALETHAYQFIHTDNPSTLFNNMKFDVIVGNPPYQLSDAGDSTGASPIYQLFVEQAKKLQPRFLTMIIPSRWFAGGKGLEGFREDMLNDGRISHLVDHPIASDVFPGIKLNGGACYFLWNREYQGECEVTIKMSGMEDTTKRRLNQFDTFVRFNKAISILDKVQSKKYSSLSELVSRQKPFGLRTFERPTGKGTVKLYANKTIGKIEKSAITVGFDMLDSWKVFISMGYGEGGEAREYPRMILGKPIVAAPGIACTETYIVVGKYKTEKEAENLAKYLQTKFLRFLVALRKNTQHVTRDRFLFVPDLPMKEEWTDEKLNKLFRLTKEEIEFIDMIVRPI